jgi:hypothetical protein
MLAAPVKSITMKNLPFASARFFSPLYCLVAAVILAAAPARAGLQIDMHLYGAYFCHPWISTNSTTPSPTNTAYFVWSPTSTINSGIHFQLNPDNTIAGSGSSWFSDYQAFIHEITNGNWTLLVTNATSTNQYTFQVTVPPTITSNLFAPVIITSPTDGQINVANTPTFTWTGPVGWAGLLEVWDNSVENNGNQTTVTSANLTPDQTSWPSPVTLPNGTNSFTAKYTSNATAVVTVSTPVDSLSQPFPGFSFISTLETYSDRRFSVGNPGPTAGGPVVHYDFDEGTELAADVSGNGNDMVHEGAIPGGWGAPSISGDTVAGAGAVYFDGGSYLTASSNLLATLAGEFSVSLWLKTSQDFGFQGDLAWMGAGVISADSPNGGAKDLIPVALTGGQVAFGIGDGSSDSTLNSSATVNDDTWHHVVVTRNLTTGERQIFIDGTLDSSDTAATVLLDSPVLLTIGAKSDASDSDPASPDWNGSNGYEGLVDDIQMYNWVLSASEVAELFANPGATVTHDLAAQLVGRYDFEDTGSAGLDSSGNGNHANCGTGNGGTNNNTFSTDAAVGSYSRLFFGDDGICFSPNGAACFLNLSNALYGSFSWTAWVKTTNSVNSDWANAYFGSPILFEYSDGANQAILSITGSKAAFTVGNPNGGSDTILHSTTTVNDGNYHFIAATRNQTTGLVKLYVDGSLEATDVSTNHHLIASSIIYLAGGYSGFFKGGLDDVRVYAGELSASEVATLSGHPLDDFNTALGSGTLTWSTSGDASWFVQTTNTHDGVSAAQSGSVINDQSSTLSTTVTGPGTLTFYWASQDDCGNFYYEFDIDESYQADIYCGEPWTQAGPFTIGSGVHTLSWTVFSNWDTDPSQAGFLDEVTFIPDLTPIITLNPFSQTNYPGYNVALLAAATNSSSITWQWFKVGNASPIPNATNALFIPTNSGTAGVAGSYYAVASSPGGSTPTTTASVSFVSAPLPPDWARALKSPFGPVDGSVFNKDYYLGCAVDPAGDIYVAAQYFGNMNVLTNGNVANILTAPGSSGAALVKHSANGNALWAVGLTNNQTGNSYGLTVAAAPGNGAYLASQISGTNWLGTNKFVDIGDSSVLLARFDASGSNVWSKFIGGTNSVGMDLNTMVSDASGNVTLAGNMSGTVNFGGTNLSAPAGGGFIVQYDANGAVRWAQTIPVYTYGLAYGNGLLYVSLESQSVSNVIYASIGSLSNVTDRAWAVACLNATNGQALWLRGVGNQYGANISGHLNDMPLISVSGSNVFLTANAFGSSVVFGGLSVPLPGGCGQYFARYDTNGNPQVATAFGNPSTMIFASAANASGVYISGDFDNYSQFGNDIIAAPVFTTNDLNFSIDDFSFVWFTQPFVAKFDLNGNPLWARNGVSSAFANFRGLAATADGVWASGFLKVKDISSPAQFGTNFVSSDLYVPGGGGPAPIIFTQAGMIAKIAESTAAAASFALLNPQTVGSNFQFQFLSQAGFNHNILYRTNLAAGNWQTNSTVSGDGTLKTITVPLSVFGASEQGFLRVSTE